MSEEVRKVKLTIEEGYGAVSTIEHPEEEVDVDIMCTMFLAAMTGITYNTKMVLEHMRDFAIEELEIMKDDEGISDSE